MRLLRSTLSFGSMTFLSRLSGYARDLVQAGVFGATAATDAFLIAYRIPNFLRRIFEIFDEHRTSVDVVATSEVSVSMTIDDATHLDALLGGLTSLGDVSVERNRGIVALVGAGLGDSTSTIAQALAALGSVTVHMVSLSSGGINLTLLVDGDQVPEAMRRVHQAFFPPQQ